MGGTLEKTNAKIEPQVYYARHMYAGLAGYEDETVLISLDTMRGMSKSFEAKPVYIEHQKVDLEKIDTADGYVSDCWFNELDGWLWSKFIIKSDEGHRVISNGWSVSNAYLPDDWTEQGGTYTNLKYDREIKAAHFTHLAIVPKPRYESARIFTAEEYKNHLKELKENQELKNSKPKGSIMGFKFFKNEKKEVTDVSELESATIELENGDEVSVKDMITAVLEKKKEEEKPGIDMNAKINVGDDEMTIEELVNQYKNMREGKENEAEEEEAKEDAQPEAKENESESEEEKANEEGAEAKKDESKEEEKKNSSHFDELKNADLKPVVKVVPFLRQDGLKVGKSKY